MKEDWMDCTYKMEPDDVLKWINIVYKEDGYTIPEHRRIEITEILEKYPIMQTVCFLMFMAGDISKYYE